jgi:hypothetical protein
LILSLQLLVPLAGPDFDRIDGSTKAEQLVDGQPLLRKTLASRSWMRRGEVTAANMVFVLRDTPTSRRFASGPLASWYPGCSVVFLGAEANGAAMSALAGLTLLSGNAPLCVDLADILYHDDLDPLGSFSADSKLGGIALTFRSSDSCYSYLRQDATGGVVEAAEKRVISDQASAGTYLFRDSSVYLTALSAALAAPETQTHAGRFFVCPLFNGVVAQGWRVVCHPVADVHDINKRV